MALLTLPSDALPLQQASSNIPIVFASVIDPVGAGIVETLARPGGLATGFTVFEYGIAGKWLELLKEIAPTVTRAAIEARRPAHLYRCARCQRCLDLRQAGRKVFLNPLMSSGFCL